MIRYYLIFGILMISMKAHTQQCRMSLNTDIPDNAKSNNARIEANTTNSVNRVLCGVRLSFTHQFADELRFVLQSPSGKRLVLIAGKTASSKTSGSTFDILFVRGDDTAHPDDFKKPAWKENKWDENQSYVGSYYPEGENGLAHFDGDRQTGSWNLIYTDLVSGGKGVLKSFELIFCQPPIFCNPCSVPRNFLNNQNFGSFCGNDPELSTVRPSFNTANLQLGYENSFLVVNKNNRIVARGLDPDLSTLNKGSYTIVGIQFRAANRGLIEGITNLNNLNNLFYGNQATLCGAISNSSSKITILSNPGYQDVVREIYGRDFIVIDGQTITSDQTITEDYTDRNGCDSLVRTRVEFKEYTPKFSQDNLYNCDHTSINVSVSTEQEFEIHRWFTKDGKISNQSDISSNKIIVNAPGSYFVVFNIEDYRDTVEYTLKVDPGSPIITLSNEYYLCSSNPLTLEIGSNFDKATVSPATTASISGNILTITEPDLYTIVVSNGVCPITKHILVKPPESSEIISIEDAIISCPDNPVEITPSLSRDYENYSWLQEGREIATTRTLTTDQPGLYTFRAYDGEQCGSTGTVWIEDNTADVNLNIEGPELINCDNQGNANRLTANFQGEFDVRWTLPDGSTSTDDSVVINGDGIYEVEISDGSGCTLTASKTVTTNLSMIDFEVPGQITILCNEVEKLITADVKANSSDYNISWNGAIEGKPKNVASVNKPGTVKVTVRHIESQCAMTKTIEVMEEDGKPKLDIIGDPAMAITCENPIRKIALEIPKCEQCSTFLTPTAGFTLKEDTLIATTPGTVTISMKNETCVSEHEISFPDETKAKDLNIASADIGCNDRLGRIEIKNKNDYSSIEFQSSTGTFEYSNSIENIEFPVNYKIVYSDKSNGCIGEMDIAIQESLESPVLDYEPIHYLDCSTGKAELIVDGSGFSQIRWFDPDNNEIGVSRKVVVDQAGKYRLVVYNASDCFKDIIIEVIDDRSSPTLNLDTEYFIPCAESDGMITLSYDTSALASTEWYGPGGLVSSEFYPDLGPGTYHVLIEGKNGCKATEQTSITHQAPGTGPAVIAPPITCNMAFSKVHLQSYDNVAQIQWIDESGQASVSDTFEVYNPGHISLIIQQNNGCLVSKSMTVQEDKAKVPYSINKPIINCHNPDPVMTVNTPDSVTRPVQYQWYFGTTPVSNEQSFDIDFPGDYGVAVWYDNGCVDTTFHTVRLDTSAVEFRLHTDTITCARSKIQLRKDIETSQITQAVWTGPDGYGSKAIRPNFQLPGTYEVVYAGKNGCTGTAEMEIYGDTKPPEVDSVDYLSLGCNDKEVDLTFFTEDSVTIQYWQSPDGQILEDSIIRIKAKGNYTLYLEGSNGCSKIDTFFIDQTVTPKFDIEVEAAGCDDQMGTAFVLPQRDTFEAVWLDPTTMNVLGRGHQSPELAAGSYLVTVINPYNDCDSTTVFEIKDISNELEVTISIDDSIRCERSQANLISAIYPPSEHYVYEWKYGSETTAISTDTMVTGISREGNYSLTVVDTVNQCVVEGRYNNVRAPSRLRYFDLFLTEPACDINRWGFAIMDSLVGASDMSLVTYSINDGPYREQDTFPFLYANESYHISAKDQYGCLLDTTLLPELRGIMDRVALIPDTTINSGDSINFNDPAFKIQYTSTDSPLSEKYTWILNPDTLNCDFDCTEMVQQQLFETRTISAQLTNEYGCVVADTFVVHVREGDILNVPNAIAPGSANVGNANACVYTNQYVEAIELFVIFNRRGNVIFKSENYSPRDPHQQLANCWNGRDQQNNIHPPGSYNYYVKYRTVYGEVKEKYGNILLIR